jgi:NAD-specific glutamate dehydrogenase
VSAWIAHNAAAVERCTQVLADVRAGDASDLAMLSVAVREIRNLIEATAAPTRGATDSVEEPVAPVGS